MGTRADIYRLALRLEHKLKTAYDRAVAWIALNDNDGDAERLNSKVVCDYLTVVLVADLFEKEPAVVAYDVIKYRKQHDRGTQGTVVSVAQRRRSRVTAWTQPSLREVMQLNKLRVCERYNLTVERAHSPTGSDCITAYPEDMKRFLRAIETELTLRSDPRTRAIIRRNIPRISSALYSSKQS